MRPDMMNGAFLSTLVPPTPGREHPSVLVVDRSADRRLFLRTSLRGRCRVATASTGHEGAAHLRHCPPQALIVGGGLDEEDRAALHAERRGAKGPATLAVWTTGRPPDWADTALRHPFTREALIEAVNRLLRGGRSEGAGLAATEALPERSRTGR